MLEADKYVYTAATKTNSIGYLPLYNEFLRFPPQTNIQGMKWQRIGPSMTNIKYMRMCIVLTILAIFNIIKYLRILSWPKINKIRPLLIKEIFPNIEIKNLY